MYSPDNKFTDELNFAQRERERERLILKEGESDIKQSQKLREESQKLRWKLMQLRSELMEERLKSEHMRFLNSRQEK